MSTKRRWALHGLGAQKRHTFRGVFAREGAKPGYQGPPERTLLLRDVTEVTSGKVVTEHLWFNFTKGFQAIEPLVEGDVIQFNARVSQYERGYKGHNWERAIENPVETDYKLSRPTRISKP